MRYQMKIILSLIPLSSFIKISDLAFAYFLSFKSAPFIAESETENDFFMGKDFNFAEINWETLEGSRVSHFFPRCIPDNFVTQVGKASTRGENFLDIVLVNDTTFVANSQVIEGFPKSYHNTARCHLIFSLRRISSPKAAGPFIVHFLKLV